MARTNSKKAQAPVATYASIGAKATLPQAPLTAQGKALQAPATTVAPTTQNAPLYALGGAYTAVLAKAGASTLQRGATGLGAQWRTAGTAKPNTRAQALAALQQLGSTFTQAQALAALQPLKTQGVLGSGSPASYFGAFVKCGYIVAQSA
jgi:hypothetical protein